MRERKFRCWDKEEKRFLDTSEEFGEFYISPDGKVEIAKGFDAPFTDDEDQYRYVLTEFTGLRDKKGKEIFEGDILQWGVHRGIVRLSGSCFVFGDEQFGLHPCNLKAEVISNVFENPELVKIRD